MDGNFEQSFAADEKALNVFEASRALGEVLVQTPLYQNFLSALRAINNDPEIQRIATQMRSHQNALQMGIDGHEHQAELSRLQAELEALPIVQQYRQTEMETLDFFRAVDDLISESIGFPFAHNAHRSSCSCGA
jgi:cell fate (sporulation/competence/biofilm development) regulator YlbF (YheA/YmcA/DUF963 family)